MGAPGRVAPVCSAIIALPPLLYLIAAAHAADAGADKGKDPFRITEVSQPPGKTSYWVLPCPRVLAPRSE